MFKLFGLKPLKDIFIKYKIFPYYFEISQQFVLFSFHCSSDQFGQTRICGPMRNLFFSIFSNFLVTLETKQWESLPFHSFLFPSTNANIPLSMSTYF